MGICISSNNDDAINPHLDDSLHVMRRVALKKSGISPTKNMVYVPRAKQCYNPSMVYISVKSVSTVCSDIDSDNEL